MSGVNKVIILGNLGNDPEVRAFADGTPVANFSVATSETWKDKQTGEKKESTEWHKVVVTGRLAEVVRDYLKKGSKVYVEGANKTRKYEKDGQAHYVTEVKCHSLQMLDSRQSTEATARSATNAVPQPIADDFGDDIPFN